MSIQIDMNTLFKNNDDIKIRIFDKIISKDMRILVGIHQNNNKFSIIVQPKSACK